MSIIVGARLIVEQRPRTQEEIEERECVPFGSFVDSLMYAMVYTRPDISHVVGVLSTYMSTLGKENWIVVKRVFRYLCG